MLIRLLALTAVLLLGACSTPHLIMLNDGTEIITADKPKYNSREGFYTFETSAGKKTKINKDKIKGIEEY